jgi:O-antigen/teichoic acid export membrane protein
VEPTAIPRGTTPPPDPAATSAGSPFARRKWVRQSSIGPALTGAVDREAQSPVGRTEPDAQPRPASGSELGHDPAGAESSPSSRKSAIVNGLRWTMIGRPASEMINLIGSAVLARLVIPAEFGRFTVALVVLALASVPTQAVGYSLIQRDHVGREHLQTGITLTVVLGLAMCALTLVASYAIVTPVFGVRTAELVRLMIPACFLNSVNTVPYAMISRRLQFRRLSIIDITITAMTAFTAIALAADGMNAAGMVIGTTGGTLAGIGLMCVWSPPCVPGFHMGAARDLLRPGVPAALAALSGVCFQNCDYMLIGARLGALQTGFYFRAYTLSVQYQGKASQVLYSVGFPVLSRASSSDEIDYLRERMVRTLTLVLLPLLVILAIVAPRFVTWFYGPAWGPAVFPVQVLTIGGAAMLIAYATGMVLLATGRPRAVMCYGWGHFAVYATAVFALTKLGIGAVAIGAAVVHTGFLFVCYLLLTRGSIREALRTLSRDLLPAGASCVGLAAAAIPASLGLSTLHVATFPYLVGVALAGGVGYLVTLRVCFPQALQGILALASRLLPHQTHRFIALLGVRPQVQSAARA